MEIFYQLFGGMLAFVYHCFDRIVINGYLSGLSRPEHVVYFFRQVLGCALTIDYFPADVNQNDMGPDSPPLPGKATQRDLGRTLSVIEESQGNARVLAVNIDDADKVYALR